MVNGRADGFSKRTLVLMYAGEQRLDERIEPE
jgi:hypothetical protein